MENMKILFMGTPDFAVFSLKALVEAGYDVIGVITQTDKPSGRGYVMTPPPVKVYASERGIPVYQPKTLRTPEFAELLAQIDPELIIVVAFGKILPQNVLDYPKYGCINVHGSLLPEYRGAAPMQRAIIDGKAVTGITTMFMDDGVDTGDMLQKRQVEILQNDNFEDIHDKLGVCGAELLLETLELLKSGKLIREKQNSELATYAPKIEKSDCLIDFSRPAKQVHDLIRGLSPIPLSFTHLPDGRLLKIVKSRISDKDSKGAEAGTVVSTDGGVFTVACGVGAIDVLRVIPEGKKPMDSADFIRGRQISVSDKLI